MEAAAVGLGFITPTTLETTPIREVIDEAGGQ